jgi:soluble lytic murein transglycosylase-like protein
MVLLCALSGTPNPDVINTRAQAIRARVQPNDAQALSQAIQEASTRFEVPSYIVTAVIEHESKYRIKAKSKSGCEGAMQLLPKTAHRIAKLLGIKKPNLKDPKTNVLLGTAYLAQLFGLYHNWGATLTAYNIGPGGYAKRKRPNGYAKAILKNIPTIKKLEKDLDKPVEPSYPNDKECLLNDYQ